MPIKFKISIPRKILTQEKELLIGFSQLLVESKASQRDIELISDLILQMDDLFMIVVAGEYNSGKSAFINALLGQEYLQMGVTPTTASIQILRFGEIKSESADSQGINIIKLPEEILKIVTFVDTPGTNAILREHEELTSDFIPKSDLVLFVTSADRPFTESERAFLKEIKEWGKKIVIILNKKDIIETGDELDEIQEFVSSNSKELLNFDPKIFTLSAKQALSMKRASNSSTDDLNEIEKFIENTLISKDRIQLKLLNPLGVIEHLSGKYQQISSDKLENLEVDIQLLDDIEEQMALFKEDMLRSYQFRYSEIDNVLLRFEKRGLEFFDENFRLARIIDLLNKEKTQADYKKKVVKNLNKEIDSNVNSLIDWLVEEDLKQWQAITQKIEIRAAEFEGRIFNSNENRQFQLERNKIIKSIKRETQRLIEKFNKDDEAKQIAEDAQLAVAASAAIEAGALGLGALVTILATSASADLTGVLLAGLTATLGFFILPAKKKQARRVFSRNLLHLRNHLTESLTNEFSGQIDTVIEKVRTTINPYSRFVRTEREKLLSFEEKITRNDFERVQMEKTIKNL